MFSQRTQAPAEAKAEPGWGWGTEQRARRALCRRPRAQVQALVAGRFLLYAEQSTSPERERGEFFVLFCIIVLKSM